MKQVPMLLPQRKEMRVQLILTNIFLSGTIKRNGDSLTKKGGQSFLSNIKVSIPFSMKV